MPNTFDEQEYRRKLIAGGLDADNAATLARRYADLASQGGGQTDATFQAVDKLLELPSPPAEPAASPAPARAGRKAAAVLRSERIAQESTELAHTMGLPPQRRTGVDAMAKRVNKLADEKRNGALATKKRSKAATATDQLADQVSQAKQAALLKHTKQQIKDLQLSLFDLAPWPDNMRALPNDFGRSAIFTVRNKKVPRAALQGAVIYSVNKDVEITYTGIELRADDDELVLAQVLEYGKLLPLGEPVSFTFYELCKDLDWPINGRYYAKAEECLTRLQASAMQFVSQRIGRLESLSLIRRFRVLDRSKRTSRCQVEIDAEIAVLFAGEHYTKSVWEKYRKLSPTARRMFDWFASHRDPFPIKLETVRLMCGSDSTRAKKWREQVGMACKELSESGLVEQAWVNSDMVYCDR